MHQKAPFNLEQITALQTYQDCDMVHPYTCPNSHNLSLFQFIEPEKLVPLEKGLVCFTCGYIQDWAINWTTDLKMIEQYKRLFNDWARKYHDCN